MLDEQFIFWLKWLDMSYVSKFLINDTTLNQYCDIFSNKKIELKNNYVFSIDKTFSDNNIEKQRRSKVI